MCVPVGHLRVRVVGRVSPVESEGLPSLEECFLVFEFPRRDVGERPLRHGEVIQRCEDDQRLLIDADVRNFCCHVDVVYAVALVQVQLVAAAL